MDIINTLPEVQQQMFQRLLQKYMSHNNNTKISEKDTENLKNILENVRDSNKLINMQTIMEKIKENNHIEVDDSNIEDSLKNSGECSAKINWKCNKNLKPTVNP